MTLKTGEMTAEKSALPSKGINYTSLYTKIEKLFTTVIIFHNMNM